VAVDLDGCLAPFSWPGLGEPYPNAVMTIKVLKLLGYKIVILSSRFCSGWEGAKGLKQTAAENKASIEWWLREWDIPFDELTCDKVPAVAYIDDKAIFVRTNDGWAGVIDKIVSNSARDKELYGGRHES
jgi:hypothetical protein